MSMKKILLAVLVFLILPSAISANPYKILSINLAWKAEKNVPNDPESITQDANPYSVVFRVVDNRADKICIGFTEAPLVCENIVLWLNNGLESINENSDKKSSTESLITCIVYIKRISCTARQMNMRCSILLDVEYYRNQSLLQKNTYFGTTTETKSIIGKSNSFDEEKIQKELNQALNICLKKIKSDIKMIPR